jgi:hypothetical protein
MTSPIRNIEALKILAHAIIIWAVVMEIWPMTDVQQAATLSLAVSLINVAGAMWQDKETTSLISPEDEDGTPLVRADNAPTRAQVRSMSK